MKRGNPRSDDGWYLALLSFPCAVLAFWAVGSGLYGVALFATLFGGLCLWVSAQ